MRDSYFSLFIALLAFGLHALAWPAMAKQGAALSRELARRQDDDTDLGRTMIGDLATVGPTTTVGQSLYNILLGNESGSSDEAGYTPPGPLGSDACNADTCCAWSYVAQELTSYFTGPTGRCNSAARLAIRLGFHDAGPWSSSAAAAGQDFGGADGSIVLSGSEVDRTDNNGLQSIIAQIPVWTEKFGVGTADMIQFAAKHAVVTCPLGPRTRVFVGRIDSSTPALTGQMPSATQSADTLINLFQDKTVIPHDLAALLGAHSVSQQFFVDTTQSGFSQDTTPGVWDVNFYNDTLQPTTAPHNFRFESDAILSADSRMSDEWHLFVGNQTHWNEVRQTYPMHSCPTAKSNVS